jgi:hypothetical protein
MFDMFKLSIMQLYIGVEFVCLLDGIMLVQKAYVVTMLETFNMKDVIILLHQWKRDCSWSWTWKLFW